MRGIGKGQRIVLFLIPEVRRLMGAESALGLSTTPEGRAAQLRSMPDAAERSRCELEDVSSW